MEARTVSVRLKDEEKTVDLNGIGDFLKTLA